MYNKIFAAASQYEDPRIKFALARSLPATTRRPATRLFQFAEDAADLGLVHLRVLLIHPSLVCEGLAFQSEGRTFYAKQLLGSAETHLQALEGERVLVVHRGRDGVGRKGEGGRSRRRRRGSGARKGRRGAVNSRRRGNGGRCDGLEEIGKLVKAREARAKAGLTILKRVAAAGPFFLVTLIAGSAISTTSESSPALTAAAFFGRMGTNEQCTFRLSHMAHRCVGPLLALRLHSTPLFWHFAHYLKRDY
jgi:hypothetical protein